MAWQKRRQIYHEPTSFRRREQGMCEHTDRRRCPLGELEPGEPGPQRGLGTGLWLFDQNGAPQNPLDTNPNRYASDGVAPANQFNPAQVRYDLDRVVDQNGVPNGSSNQPLNLPVIGPNRRDGAPDPQMAGPLGATLSRRLADPVTGIVLNSWVDADRTPRGGAATVLNQ